MKSRPSVLRIVSKIKKTLKKRGDCFRVQTPAERAVVLREVKAMKRYGSFGLTVTTRKDEAGGWKVVAI